LSQRGIEAADTDSRFRDTAPVNGNYCVGSGDEGQAFRFVKVMARDVEHFVSISLNALKEVEA